MFPQNMLETKSKFYCEFCDYSCSKVFLWKQHLKTDKHNGNAGNAPARTAARSHSCELCGKKYQNRSGLWKHKRSCHPADKSKSEIIVPMSRQANRREDELLAHIAAQNRIIESLVPKVGTTNNNVNVNLFLNEHCCNAINMSEFIESLHIRPSDLEYTQTNGLVQGVAAVFVNALNRLDTSMRPIHCTDIDRETLYVREDNSWNNDATGGRIQSAIKNVAGKHRQAIHEWEEAHPAWAETEEGKMAYVELVKSLTDDVTGSGDTNRIVRSLAQATVVPVEDMLMLGGDSED